jgi:L-ascorbate metabolism protein UlaG (beta-lactamase superfamily)
MRLIKYTHSCVRLDDGDRALVIDPGTLSEASLALEGAAAVLITHEHADHIDADAVVAAGRANLDLRVWGPASIAAAVAELGDRFTAVGPGESFDAAGFGVQTFGALHALIHPLVGPLVANVGYLVDGALFHPGDSFTVPTVPVETLLVPIHAPWSKISEVLDFAISVRAQRAFQIHDGLLNDMGRGFVGAHLTRIGALYGTQYRLLAPGDVVDL